ncbi:MarR family winged helix-turn-helix transcriptional regulator [Janthinobacterium lividum]|uniref:MarR family winged helix-turn-helix transcriptional regulator n=1 Tax=Janthinobacterium lividum TaxID=29581 RepID=UPI0008735F04|nr:MarR family winged helix-turn-helix transcriptional regulator [Janthinobacterium lividum]MCC7716659.1 winged helix-turn-helix transcriptional regulator [Janthinobacterium lividum]OEZ64520.1 MarR family protein [Janthinobacterium lividum]WQE32001.1 MarR family winged helix-turn-helix transcriptional regulator [Janthinobacterium lividum]STS86001.1 MarR family [Janthinobacterium lividum]
MNTNLGFCLALHHAHANLQLKLDDELGIHHGISFNDFVLLNVLAQADGGQVSIPELVRPLGQSQSSVLRQLIVLEKIGLVVREGENGCRQAVLRPAGRALVNSASETANGICTEAVESIPPAAVETMFAALKSLHARQS